jgi:tryptophanyl-tRNA synthetase
MNKKTIVSGIQASGRLHIGNYFGAMKQNIELSNSGEYNSYIFIADYHSMTTLTDAEERRKSSFDLACAYLACGLDTTTTTLFKQSDVPEHTELSWILSTVTPFPMLMLGHSFKDKTNPKFESLDVSQAIILEILNEIQIEQNGKIKKMSAEEFTSNMLEAERRLSKLSDEELQIRKAMTSSVLNIAKYQSVNAGLFTYPVLMASDILMYQANLVPVGKDQAQHLEMTREMAGKFNRAYNTEFFTMPQAHIKKEVEIVPGVDGAKMSKSKGNVIPLFGSDEEIKKAVMSIVTDSARPEDKKNAGENNIFNIHKLFLNDEEVLALRAKFEEGGYGYKEAKESCAEAIISFISPKREKYDYYQNHQSEVFAILEEGKQKAKKRAEETMSEVRKIVGLS